MADGRNDPDAHIAVIQAAVVASVSLFTDVSIPLSLSLTLLIIQSLLHPACPSLLLFSSVLKRLPSQTAFYSIICAVRMQTLFLKVIDSPFWPDMHIMHTLWGRQSHNALLRVLL